MITDTCDKDMMLLGHAKCFHKCKAARIEHKAKIFACMFYLLFFNQCCLIFPNLERKRKRLLASLV